jgi:hypothetical protein
MEQEWKERKKVSSIIRCRNRSRKVVRDKMWAVGIS